jgi:hypothetical protein
MTIRPFIRDASFNPEAVRVMSLAYDRAKAQIRESDPASCEILAMRIVTLASCGVLDLDELTGEALKGMALLKTA